ncbi:CD225/dispanin family protein [Stenotrophomonas sp. HITSZ_GD]|uniref:CD225/dispanin family protein n=1 Tax=Stenotrophomonas sp. HITSZ_GD TaxID=3037248 RepID=UPI00240D18FB|nr:CD225/dispanin family protein [Stenotrophomonas sp. HITSZ_GD]MDG2526151.1 CD225/dispanin family protein [Stenotrophomonas sp. HITSZ_GD]
MSAVPPIAPPPAPAQPIPNYLAWSIISTVLATCLCCPIGLLGIVAIVYASKVNNALAAGDLDGARRASANAKTWCWVATALAIIGLVINVVWLAVGGAQGYLDAMQQMQQMS